MYAIAESAASAPPIATGILVSLCLLGVGIVSLVAPRMPVFDSGTVGVVVLTNGDEVLVVECG